MHFILQFKISFEVVLSFSLFLMTTNLKCTVAISDTEAISLFKWIGITYVPQVNCQYTQTLFCKSSMIPWSISTHLFCTIIKLVVISTVYTSHLWFPKPMDNPPVIILYCMWWRYMVWFNGAKIILQTIPWTTNELV